MRSEHNRGASLAAFLLAVSTMTLLFVSPVEGQECTTDADCFPSLPFCIVPEGATEGECGECVVSAYPGGNGSCPDIPVGEPFAGPQVCGRTTSTDPVVTSCVGCAFLAQEDGITSAADCETVLAAPPFNQEADVVANCQRECFDYFACTSEGDCPTTQPFCNVPDGETEGVCGECVVGAFPGENGSCPVLEGQDDAGRQICGRSPPDFSSTICVSCFSADEEFEFEFGTDPTAADCQILVTEFNQTADVSVNCQRECFAVYSCATNADCPDTLPICNAGQCEISIFSPLDGMGGGSSA